MMLNGRTILFVALGCGLIFSPPTRLRAQQSADSSKQAQTAADQDVDPLKR